MKVVRKMAGRTLMESKRSGDIRLISKIDHITDWILHRKITWNEHTIRMLENRIITISRGKSPRGRRCIGIHRKR